MRTTQINFKEYESLLAEEVELVKEDPDLQILFLDFGIVVEHKILPVVGLTVQQNPSDGTVGVLLHDAEVMSWLEAASLVPLLAISVDIVEKIGLYLEMEESSGG